MSAPRILPLSLVEDMFMEGASPGPEPVGTPECRAATVLVTDSVPTSKFATIVHLIEELTDPDLRMR